jgi:plastocyanin
MKRLPLLALPLTLLALAGCGSSSNSSSPASSSTQSSSTPASTSTQSSGGASAGGTIKVDMKNLAFTPDTINAKVGQTVEWTNSDTPAHNVTYVSGPKFKSSGTINPGGTFSIKVTQAGTIHYVCTIHPFMKATIVVSK